MFERYERLDNEASSKKEGSGLGLCIVKSIIDYFGGSIKVQSSIGDGTTFIISLPILNVNEQDLVEINNINIETQDLDSKVLVEMSDARI